MARSASPLRLTDFGVQANKTGFSPDSCRHIISVLQDSPPFEQENIANAFNIDNSNSVDKLLATASKLLRELGTLPEQTISDIKKELSGTKMRKLRMKPNDFEQVLSLWLEGESEEIIFSELPSVKRSKMKPKIQQWVTGLTELSEWDSEFDRFTDIVSAVFENFLPWLMRACDYLSSIASGWSTGIDWQEWAGMLEKGVNSKWAVEVINKDAPSSRKAIVIVGSELPAAYLTEADPLGIASIKNDLIFRHQVEDIFLNLARQFDSFEAVRNDLINLYKWLWEQANLPIRDIFDVSTS